MDQEIGRIAREGVPVAELTRLKARMLNQFYESIEDPLDRADALAKAQVLNGHAAFLYAIPARIQGVSAADLQRAACTYLIASNRIIIDRVPAPASK